MCGSSATVGSSKIINLDEYRGDINNMTSIKKIDELKKLVDSYFRPRDINRIINGIKNGDKIPMPIILKGSNGLFIMSGNTRQNVAFIMGVPVEAILINVSIWKNMVSYMLK